MERIVFVFLRRASRINWVGRAQCSTSLGHSDSLQSVPPASDRIPDESFTKPDCVDNLYHVSDISRRIKRKREKHQLSEIECKSFIQLCSTPWVYGSPEIKVKTAEDIFHQLIRTGHRTISTGHFNLLLQVYLYNDHNFEPSKFLALMKAYNCEANLDTFKLFLEAYCNQGNIHSALQLHSHMRSVDLSMSEDMRALLITGHASAGQLHEAERLLEELKTERGGANADWYLRLLCAYADRGLVDKIEKILNEMRDMKVSVTREMKIGVLESLCKSGHGRLVEKMLYLLPDMEQLPLTDLRYVAYSCLARGELEAALVIMKYLNERNGMNENIIVFYITAATDKGEKLRAVVDLLNKHDLKHPWFPDLVMRSMIWRPYNSRQTYLNYREKGHLYPWKDGLQPHPLGKQWVYDTRYALQLMASQAGKKWVYFFYPLLARHCSDGDIRELVKTFHLMMCHNIRQNKVIKGYIQKTFSNADMNMEDLVTLEDDAEMGDTWHKQVLLFQLAHSQFCNVQTTLAKISDAEEYLPNAQEVFHALMIYNNDRGSLPFLASVSSLVKKGAPLAWFTNLFFTKTNELNMDLVDRILRKRIKISCHDIVSYLMSLVHSEEKVPAITFKEVWLLMELCKYTPSAEELKFFFIRFIRVSLLQFNGMKLSDLYDRLPLEMQNSFEVQCYYIVYLTIKKDYAYALREFKILRESNPTGKIPIYTWKRMVCAAYDIHPAIGKELMEEMKLAGHKPDKNMLIDVLACIKRQNDFESCDDILQQLRSIDETYGYGYEIALSMWSRFGELERIESLKKSSMPVNPDILQQAKIVALLFRNEVDVALEEAEKLTQLHRTYLLQMVRFLLRHDHSLDAWEHHVLIRWNWTEEAYFAILLFACLELNLLGKAKTIYEAHSHKLSQTEVNKHLRTYKGNEYKDKLTKLGIFLADNEEINSSDYL